VLIGKPRAWLLGLMALLLVGSYAPATASAQGPFWYHRGVGEKGNGVKIAASAPEGIASSAGEQFFLFKVAGMEVAITSPQAQLKGIIYNNGLQGQAKILIAFAQPTTTKPAGCLVKIGTNNIITVFGHLAWTWDGSEAQLKEQPQSAQKPDWVFTGKELAQGATELPQEEIYKITLSNCAAAGTFPVKGNYAGAIEPPNVGEWSTNETQILQENGARQHFWNGKSNIGAETRLLGGTEPFTHVGEYKFKTTGRQGGAPQEVARFES
jgi:hypothetical protein